MCFQKSPSSFQIFNLNPDNLEVVECTIIKIHSMLHIKQNVYTNVIIKSINNNTKTLYKVL